MASDESCVAILQPAMLPETLQFCRLRLGERRGWGMKNSLVALVSACVVGDIEVSTAALAQTQAKGLDVNAINSKVRTPFGGAALLPLQAAVCSPLDPAVALHISSSLLDMGAAVNFRWRDCGGEHTPLSKALVLRNFKLAQLLVHHGADCTAALLQTDLLESSRFDPALVRWLLDRDADVATALRRGGASNPCCGQLSCQAGGREACATACCCPPVPAVAVLLHKLQRELHTSRQLSKLHAAAGSGQEEWLLRRSADVLEVLLAAGAAPVGAPDPSGEVQAAVASMRAADWEAVKLYATHPLQWSPATHHRFPRAFKRAAREVLLVARRGFALPIASSGSGRHSGVQQQRQNRPARESVMWLDGNVVLNIVRHLAPCIQM